MSKSAKQPVSQSEFNNDDIELAQQAASGDLPARKQVNELIAPIINYQTNRFCKRYCKENRVKFQCTLNPPVASASDNAALCEWGNGSYAWMLDDLSSSRRLKKYQARNNASLFDYCYVIANSLPFYERWKDWRFGRKIYVPAYIQAMGKVAVSVFYGMRSQQNIEQMCQKTGYSPGDIKSISRKIVRLLTKKNKLHLLNASRNISLTQDADENHGQQVMETETAVYDEPIEILEDRVRLSKAWKQLTVVEQFVLDALVIEEQDAQIVLNTLKKMNLSIKHGVPADETDRQQLYYFRRKTLAKLGRILSADNAVTIFK